MAELARATRGLWVKPNGILSGSYGYRSTMGDRNEMDSRSTYDGRNTTTAPSPAGHSQAQQRGLSGRNYIKLAVENKQF